MYLTFRGDVSETIVGQIAYSDVTNKFSEAASAEYFPLADLTRVRFDPVDRDDERQVMPDEFGELRLMSND